VPGIRIALYGGPGAFLGDKGYPYQATLEQAASGLGNYSLTVLKEDGIRQHLTRDNFDVVFFPGGWGSGQAEALGDEGISKVQAFVSGGGGYIGTCAGAFLGMINMTFLGNVPSGIQSLGSGRVKIEFTDRGFQEISLDRHEWGGNVSIWYQGGPVLPAESIPSSVNILSWYRTEVPSWDPDPKTINTPAMLSTKYGAGLVMLNSPHPCNTNSTAGLGVAVYRGELAWVLRRSEVFQAVMV
jgi:glutamine amidotransferase-like uncharacterized protein